MYIYRELQKKIKFYFNENSPCGLILSGIVGCGKTTMIEALIEGWKSQFEIFAFSGDSSQFRQSVREDSEYLYKFVKARTSKPSLLFVDEVQKCEELFDAIKIAFDKGKISFIISGSNPAYLATIARKRLQRRADFLILGPISLREIIFHQSKLTKEDFFSFENLLWPSSSSKPSVEADLPKFSLTEEIKTLSKEYFIFGGLPLVLLTENQEQKLIQIKMVVERGFELMYHENNTLADIIRVELAKLHSQEFTYKNILEKTRVKSREIINKIIDELANNGYLVRKKPLLFEQNRTSYLSVFSYIDPGIVTYLTGEDEWGTTAGARVEGYVHERLSLLIANSPFKSNLHYYKPYTLDVNDKVKYQKGEVDFVFQHGKRIIPIEVKASFELTRLDLDPLKQFINKNKLQYGIVVYGGAPYFDKQNKILFWPFWLI